MTQHSNLTYQNKLLGMLALEDLEFIAPHLEAVELKLHDRLENPGEAVSFIYFPENGIVSVVGSLGVRRDVEVGLLGREGMTGISLVQYDSQSPYITVVQLAGRGLRLPTRRFVEALERSQAMRVFLTRYARAFSIQVSFTALANGRAKLEDRLARWLLMIHDRVDGNSLRLTHEYMSVMLGVRRPGVTVALHVLEGKGLVKSNRGEVIIRDREGLVIEAAGTYGGPEAEYTRLTGISLQRT